MQDMLSFVEIVVAGSALRHGIAGEDVLHALRNAVDAWLEDEEGFSMVVGADRSGRLIEVGYVDSVDARVVVHAMPVRPKFLRR